MKHTVFHKGAFILMTIALLVVLAMVSEYVGLWLIAIMLGIGSLALFYSFVCQLKDAIVKPTHRLYAKDFSLKIMATFMGFLLLLGTLLYLYVFYTIGHDAKVEGNVGHTIDFSNIEYLFRSLICSLDLFMLDVDSNLLDRLDSRSALKGWLSFQAVISFACTVAMLVGLVYSRLSAYYRLNYRTKINDSHNHLYLFFGNNEPSELLIKDIVRNDPKAVAIIIDEANVKDDCNDEWEGIVRLVTHKQNVFKTAEKIGAHVAIAGKQLDDIDDDIADMPDFDAFGSLGLLKIKDFVLRLRQTVHPQLHIFFMGEDEELNIRNIIALAKDKTVMALAEDANLYHRIYCHARYNGPNRVIQDVALKKHLNIKIVDSSHIAVEILKLNPDYHPVNVVKVSKECLAAVESPLKTLIVGFGEVGRDAFRFLYEFGAFVDSENINQRSPFECVVVDKNLSNVQGTFKASMPGIFMSKQMGETVSIRFKSIDYNDEAFYQEILTDEFAKGVNYVVISIGNNDEAISLASRIFNKVRRVRSDVSNLRIIVRCTDNNKVEGVQKIADHYNYGYGKGEKNQPVIHVFGQPEKTYTYDLVVSDRLIERAKLFHEKYRALSGEGDSWDKRHKKLTETGTPNIESLRKLRRQEAQDRANALHVGTKTILLENAMKVLSEQVGARMDWHSFYLRFFKSDGTTDIEGSQKEISYPRLSDAENKVILHLAMLEHIRWNAAHELMGYVYNEDENECNERTMKHNCLCPWNKLGEQSDKTNEENKKRGNDWVCDYQKYDFCVVDATIALNNGRLLYDKPNGRTGDSATMN